MDVFIAESMKRPCLKDIDVDFDSLQIESPEAFCSANGQTHAQEAELELMQKESNHKDIAEPIDRASLRRFRIYQLKDFDGLRGMRFKPFDFLQKNGIACDIRNYDLVYSDRMRPHETLETLFYKYNMERLNDPKGSFLSVSDVIVIKGRGKSTAYYVESFGFKQLDCFEGSYVGAWESRERVALGDWREIGEGSTIGCQELNLCDCKRACKGVR